MWQYTQTSINSQLNKMVDNLYQKLSNKWTHYKDTKSKLPEDSAEAPKHVGAFVTIKNILIQYFNIPYILEANPHPNLIRTSFCRFLKRKKS